MTQNNKKSEVEKLKNEIDRLKKELKKKKKYGLVWKEKSEDVVEMCKEKLPIVKEVKNKEIITDKNKPVNLLIEGDNYHSLSVLNYTHEKSIDVIYIDPPFNTGARDWKYNNDYVDAEDPYRHSKWISMMEKRLRLAKNLLRETGIIIIAIDDYELFTLGLIADEIFLEKNRIGIIPVRNNPPGRAISKYFATSHEYYLFYAKNINRVAISNVPIRDISEFIFKDNISVYRRKPLSMRGHGSLEERPNNYFPIYVNIKSSKISLEKMPDSIEIFPHKGKDGKQRVWDYPKDSMRKLIENGDIEFVQEKNRKVSLYKKDRLEKGMRPKSLWLDAKYDSSAYGAVLLKKMFNNNRIFDYPKSLYAVIDAIFVSSDNKKDVTVLDFFAGSGTTAHAVLILNKEDGGNRKFILCTNNENDIATEVCYPRIKKVIGGHKDYPDITGIPANLRYFRTDFVDAEPTDKNKIKLTQQATEMLCIREGTFEKVLEQKDFKIFKNSQHYTGIIFDQLAIPEFKKEIKDIRGKFSVYVFSFSDETFDEEFVDIKQKVKLSPIPEAILRVYRRIFR